MVKMTDGRKRKVGSLKLGVSVLAFDELGRVIFSAFKKSASSGEIRTAVGWRGFSANYLPEEVIIQLSVGPNKSCRVEGIIDVSSDNSPFGTADFLHILSCRHKKLNAIFRSETKLNDWFFGSVFDPKSKGETELKAVVGSGFTRTKARLAELPVKTGRKGDAKEILSKWHINIPFVLRRSQSAYIPHLADTIASGDLRKEEDRQLFGKNINTTVIFS